MARAYSNDGYTDWYLPSKDELNKLYLSQSAIGGFGSDDYYWSSSEYAANKNGAWVQGLGGGSVDGLQSSTSKGSPHRVRAVRSF